MKGSWGADPMARFLREVPREVAHQAMVNKTINASMLQEVKDDPAPDVEADDLDVLARDVSVPELVPYEYAYVDVYTDGERYYVALNHTFYRRSLSKTLDPA